MFFHAPCQSTPTQPYPCTSTLWYSAHIISAQGSIRYRDAAYPWTTQNLIRLHHSKRKMNPSNKKSIILRCTAGAAVCGYLVCRKKGTKATTLFWKSILRNQLNRSEISKQTRSNHCANNQLRLKTQTLEIQQRYPQSQRYGKKNI